MLFLINFPAAAAKRLLAIWSLTISLMIYWSLFPIFITDPNRVLRINKTNAFFSHPKIIVNCSWMIFSSSGLFNYLHILHNCFKLLPEILIAKTKLLQLGNLLYSKSWMDQTLIYYKTKLNFDITSLQIQIKLLTTLLSS